MNISVENSPMHKWITITITSLCIFLSQSIAEVNEEQVAEQADPKSLSYTKWTPDFQIPNPVAISFDEQGRAYVTETLRRKANDLDIRRNKDWITNDLSFQSTEDKLEFYKKTFTPENSDANKNRVKDYNKDGVHDLKDLTFLSERVHFIEDQNNDGIADYTHIYAEQLNHVIGGVAGGVLAHEGDVFACPVPELVKFTDTNKDNKADKKEVVIGGFGVHLAYGGHDMHGLIVGPDGRLYWSIGDKGVRVKSKEGRDYKFPNQGALMRCEIDGSNFEVYAHGLRNIQEIGFDKYGNFFGVDNDADFSGEKERFIYVEQYLDAGWRANWQYLKGDYNPWQHENMHIPFHEGQSIGFTPPISLYVDGPAGFKANPGTALNEAYQDYFFLTSALNGHQYAFQIKPKGDSFEMVNDHRIGEGIPIVGLAFSPDGALFGVDWGGGYPLNDIGAVWKVDSSEEDRHPLRNKTKELIQSDYSKREISNLIEDLRYPDQRIRLKSQFELAKRNSLESFSAILSDTSNDQLARIHSIWGIGQLIRKDKATDEHLIPHLEDADPEIKAQTVKTLTDRYGHRLGLHQIPGPSEENKNHPLSEKITPLLYDESLRVKTQALLAMGRIGDSTMLLTITDALNHHQFSEIYIRHAGAMALAGVGTSKDLMHLGGHYSNLVRGCAVVALGKRGDKNAGSYLKDPNPTVKVQAAHAVHDDWMIPDALEELAESLSYDPTAESHIRRAINANFHLGDKKSINRVTKYLQKENTPDFGIDAAIEALQNWTTPPDRDLVVGRYRPIEERDPKILQDNFNKNIKALLSSPKEKIRASSLELARTINLNIPTVSLIEIVKNKEASGSLRSEALKTLSSQEYNDLENLLLVSSQVHNESLSQTATELFVTNYPEQAVPLLKEKIATSTPSNKQHAIRLLAQTEDTSILESLISKIDQAPASQQLDIYLTAKDTKYSDNKVIQEKLTSIESNWATQQQSNPFSTEPFLYTLEGGNIDNGKKVFLNHEAAQCIRCHKLEEGTGSEVGPLLSDIGTKGNKYLLESLIHPADVVAAGYGNTSITLKTGKTIAGIDLGEKDNKIMIRDTQGKEQAISKDEIVSQTPAMSTMPPMGFVLSKEEIRDLVAFLVSLKNN